MSLFFSKRVYQEELMDDLHCSGEVVNQTLRELDMINAWLGGNAVTLRGVSRLLQNSSHKNISLVDLGCGSGDMLRRLRLQAIRKQWNLDLAGIDANPNIAAYARNHLKAYPDIAIHSTDIHSESFRLQTFDVVIATLFLHHFTESQLIQIFSNLKENTRIGIVVNDIHRHWLAYFSIQFLTRIFSRSAMVRFDAPLSVLRSFRRDEIKSILRKAGIFKYSLRWCWAFRWQLIIPLEKK